jgi:mTERF domain-containing protein
MLTSFFLILWQADSGTDGSFNLKVVPPALLAAEKEEAKAVLTLFLKKQGLSNAVASRTINKSDLFIDHLVSRLHSVHKSRYLVGSISTYYCFF